MSGHGHDDIENEMDVVLENLAMFLGRMLHARQQLDEFEQIVSLAARIMELPKARISNPADALITLDQPNEDEMCTVCLEAQTDCVTPCDHHFHRACLEPWFELSPFDDDEDDMRHTNVCCPTCKHTLSTICGDQPAGMTFQEVPSEERDGYLVIEVTYQESTQHFYLPDSEPGRDALARLRKAFDLGILFTTDADGDVVSNGFDLKRQKCGSAADGFPDETYFFRLHHALKSVHL